ncbi:MAG: polysaccharide biosynthesis tyrosine autokinase [Kiritimatiellia bacterium]
MKESQDQTRQDPRIYLGMLLFRWQVIAICFLYALLGAVLYINLSPQRYRTHCKVMSYRDPLLVIQKGGAGWSSLSFHRYLLTSRKLRERTARILADEWRGRFDSFEDMILPVSVRRERGFGRLIDISVESVNEKYAAAFLKELIAQHKTEWNNIQMQSAETAGGKLEEELARLEDKIEEAEDDVIQHQRLYDIARVEARSTMEARYLESLMARRSALTTELMLLEAKFPELEKASAAVLSHVRRLMRETGEIEPAREGRAADDGLGDETERPLGPAAFPGETPAEIRLERTEPEEVRGYRELRIKLTSLEQREAQLARNLKPEHPRLEQIRAEIKRVRQQLEFAAKVEMSKLKDRRDALLITINALETAEENWKGSNLLASKRRAELRRIADRVNRFENNYHTLYARLHDMRVEEELKSEHFHIHEPVTTADRPVWPDPAKILFMAVVLGLGSGLGLAVVAQVMDNKVQTIADVEQEIGAPFLGGVPYWVHAGLEKSIRPIVTEEHSSGAVEAYRNLRTNLLASLAKRNEKIVMFTSADSREGKTLTVLNTGIMIAEMGKRVLLVDFDLRRGRLHRALAEEKQPGMSDVLMGKCSLRETVIETRIENLHFVPCGKSQHSTAEVLQAADLNEMFVNVQDDYDYILWDTSPVLRITDASIIAGKKVAPVVYVTRVNHTPKPMVKYSLDMLKDVTVLGFILNSIEMHRISSLYYAYQYPSYAYYSNAYRYGYDYHYHYGYGEYGGRGRSRRRGGYLGSRIHDMKEWFRETFLPTG